MSDHSKQNCLSSILPCQTSNFRQTQEFKNSSGWNFHNVGPPLTLCLLVYKNPNCCEITTINPNVKLYLCSPTYPLVISHRKNKHGPVEIYSWVFPAITWWVSFQFTTRLTEGSYGPHGPHESGAAGFQRQRLPASHRWILGERVWSRGRDWRFPLSHFRVPPIVIIHV